MTAQFWLWLGMALGAIALLFGGLELGVMVFRWLGRR